MIDIKKGFKPDYAVPPGETLREVLEYKGMNQSQLSERMGRPIKTINEIINGKAAITTETALQLELVLGVSSRFWNNLERNYRETLARLEERKRLKAHVKLLRQYPIREMTNHKWIEPCKDDIDKVKELLGFFGVSSPGQLKRMQAAGRAVFRKSRIFSSDYGALDAWMRKGELEAIEVPCDPYDDALFRATLSNVRTLSTREPDVFVPELSEICARCGVAVVFIPELMKSRACGVTRWLSRQKALIQLSLRYKTNDHLWFTFFHEAGHIILHGKQHTFIETDKEDDSKEEEADRFASDLLIQPMDYEEFLKAGRFNESAVREFADKIGIAPGIVVGRLQHDRHIPYNRLNHLKQRYTWSIQD